MVDNKKNILSEEHLRKIKYRFGYKINESARYRSLVNSGDEFDNIPEVTNEADEQPDLENKPEAKPSTPTTEPQPPAEQQPEVSANNTPAPSPETDINAPLESQPPMGDPMAAQTPVETVDNIQNEIIKHNLAAMQSIYDQLHGLNSLVMNLNSKLDGLEKEVEEVREPSNVEKLINKKDVSYPYYFNLNDFWKDNWFSKNRENEKNTGIRELPDGTYVADFDDLPDLSKSDVMDSFNKF